MKKKQSFARNFVIRIPIYEFDVMVSVHEEGTDVAKKISKKLHGDLSEDALRTVTSLSIKPGVGVQGRAMMFESGPSLLWVKWNPKETQDWGFLNHETLHIVEFIMNRVGIVMDKSGGEAWNYLLQYLTRRIYEKL